MVGKQNVFVWQWGRLGAGPRYAYELANAINTHTNWNAHLSISENSDLFRGLTNKDNISFPVKTRGTLKYSFLFLLKFPKIAYDLNRFLSQTKPAAAVCCMVSIFDYLVVYLLRKQGIPVFIIIHDATSHPGDPYDWVIRLQNSLLKKCRGVITLSEYVRDALKLSTTTPKLSSCVIPHPSFEFPDLALPAPRLPAFPKRKPIKLLFAGRMKTYKGGKLLAEAIALLHEHRFTLQISGETKHEDWVLALQKLEHCKLDLRSHWHTEAELVEAVDESDLVLAPYVEASQSGIIALALARGRPVVTTPAGGLAEQIIHEKSGLISLDISSQAVADQIHRFIEEPELFQKCANGAAEIGTKKYGWQKVAPQFISYIEKALSPDE